MVFKAFYYYHFCPLQSISCISKVVIKRNVLIPENHGHPDDTKQTKKRGIHSWLTRTHQLAPCCHVGWGHTKKTQMIALILAKKNLSGLAGSYFQLRSDFQQHCPDTVTTLGTSGPASNTHVMMLIYIFTSTRTHWTLCWGWDYLFFYRFSKINHTLFFFFYTGMSLHLTTARTFARQKKHVIKLRDAHTLLLSLLLERHARQQIKICI